MIKLKALMLALLLLTFSNSITYCKGHRSERGRLKIVGTVVAYDRLAGLFDLTSTPNSRLLIMRVEKRGKSEKARYIQVEYIFWPHEKANNEINDGTRSWRFTLNRDPSCDGLLQDVSFTKGSTVGGAEVIEPRLKWTNSEEEKEVPADQILPCYTLHSKDIKPF